MGNGNAIDAQVLQCNFESGDMAISAIVAIVAMMRIVRIVRIVRITRIVRIEHCTTSQGNLIRVRLVSNQPYYVFHRLR